MIHSDNDLPHISLIVITLNEADNIKQCLQSIVDQDYPPDKLELVCVDSSSTDGTVEVINRFPFPKTVKVITNPRHSPAYSINVGLGLARHRFVQPVGGDVQVGRDFLRAAVNEFANGDPNLFCVNGLGRETAHDQPSFIERIYQTYLDYQHSGDVPYPRGSGLFNRQALPDGTFAYNDRISAEDEVDLGIRMRARGLRFRRLPLVMFVHDVGRIRGWAAWRMVLRRLHEIGRARAILWRGYSRHERALFWQHIQPTTRLAITVLVGIGLMIGSLFISPWVTASLLGLTIIGLAIQSYRRATTTKTPFRFSVLYLVKKILLDAVFVSAVMLRYLIVPERSVG